MPIHDECNAARRKKTRFHGALWVGIGISTRAQKTVSVCGTGRRDAALPVACSARTAARRAPCLASGQRHIHLTVFYARALRSVRGHLTVLRTMKPEGNGKRGYQTFPGSQCRQADPT